MSRIPPRLARRVDRLARAGHLFHRFAHHPLCGRYATEVVRVGRRGRVCLGCLSAGSGVAVGAAVGLAVAVPWAVAAAVGAAGVALGLGSTFRRRPGPRRRWAKLLTRTLPAGALVLAVTAGLRLAATGAPVAGLAVGVLAAAALAATVLAYRRRGPDRRPCLTCPEREGTRPCAGVAPLVRRERAIQRLAGRWLDGAGL